MTDWGKYVGIPFAEHGRDKQGCDCWGLVRLVYQEEFGIDLPDLSGLYATTRDFGGMRTVYNKLVPSWEIIAVPNEGDVVLLNIMGAPIHVGISVGNDRMLHVERGIDTAVERLDSPLWKNRIAGFYRYIGYNNA